MSLAGVRIIRAGDLRPMPWKNGGGATREIAVSPAGAGIEDFDWRVSMATVAADGPFSIFPGIERTLTVLDGGGLRLAVAGLGEATLRPGDAPYAFPGDAEAAAALIGGPVIDFNVMTRRGRLTHRVRVVDGAAVVPAADARILLVLCRHGALAVATAEGDIVLERHDCALFDGVPPPISIEGAALVVEIAGPIVAVGFGDPP